MSAMPSTVELNFSGMGDNELEKYGVIFSFPLDSFSSISIQGL